MNPKPESAVFCRIPSLEEAKSTLLIGKPFTPYYEDYLNFHRTAVIGENFIEECLGHINKPEAYHTSMISTIYYIIRFRNREPVYITFDNISFYNFESIFPQEPLLFRLKKINHESIAKMPAFKMTHPLDFGHLSGKQFEWLVYCLVEKINNGNKVEWIGQVGSDNGLDIISYGNEETTYYQCVNHRILKVKKIFYDIDRCSENILTPSHFIVVSGRSVTAKSRDKIVAHAKQKGFIDAEVWSGAELEEKLRKHGPDIMERFFYQA